MSQHPLATHAVGEVVGEVLDRLGDEPDAAAVFVTSPFAGAMEDIAATVRTLLRPASLIGATAASVLAGEREVEGEAAVSLFAMRFGPRRRFHSPPVTEAVRIRAEREDDGWRVEASGSAAFAGSTLVLLADPFSFPVETFIEDLGTRRPGLTVVGGLASSSTGPGGNRLVADGRVFSDGAVGLLLPAGVGVTPVVSQGCRPVGEPLVVTKASGNLLEEIAGQPALDRLMAQADAATTEDRNRMARGLHVGLVVDERKAEFDRGDFLIRSVLGADHARKAVAVGAEVEVGATVQFQVRDADSADEDLRDLLAGTRGDAALLFTCTGRGTALFGTPHHDARIVSQHVDGGPVAGMFCAGEVGPLGDRTFVHVLSATALLFDDPF
ncbi:MAG TPA: FIST N-terminal domain-containing protein [Acidimicrobiales bacterium]|nr:FIST N-terminal domain-containing protein [Acidimicrobiales bacterium]